MINELHAERISVLEVLKAQGCISGYRADCGVLTPEWSPGGQQRTLDEVMTNAKPFGLLNRRRVMLMIFLPGKMRERIYDALRRKIKRHH